MKHARRPVNLSIVAAIGLSALMAFLSLKLSLSAGAGAQTTPSVIYYQFDPLVIHVNRTEPVLFQAAVNGSPTQVILQYTANPPTVNLEMRDDGTNGDPVAGDNIYSVTLAASQVTQGLLEDDVFRRYIGFLRLFQGATPVVQANVFADVLTDQIPRPPVTVLAADAQRNDAVVNLIAPGFYNPNNVVSSFNYGLLAQRFYQLFGDDYDFFNVIVTPTYLQNRFHFGVRNRVQGIGMSQFNNSAQYGNPVRLQGISAYPIPQLFDGADTAYQHELGHQWINFLPVAPVNVGIPHWPISSLASGIMGFSLPGGTGGSYPCLLVPEAGGVRLTPRTAPPVFADLDLYMMGLLPAEAVGEHLIFADQTQAATLQCNNQLFTDEMTPFNVSNVTSALGPRLPNAANAQKNFRVATIIVSRQALISEDAMAFYSYFSRRAEATQDVPYHLGLAKGTARPFALSTGGRGTLNAQLQNGVCPAIAINPAALPAGRMGEQYQQTLTASGGQTPHEFILVAGGFPAGLSFTSAGVLSGAPAVAGTFNVTVRATDANGCAGERSYTLTVHPPCGTITVNPATLPNGFAGAAYNQTLTATGGVAPYSFAVVGGSLPGGLNLSAGGALTGTPTTRASFSFTVRATDAIGCFGERQFTVLISGDGLMFYPLVSPVRLLDTRTGFTGCTTGVGELAAGSTRTQPARTACSTIPAGATAVIGNITVVPSGPGYLTLFPSDAAQPTVANSNFTAGEVTNNFFTVGLGASGPDAGAFKIFTSATTDVIIDVTGYYAPPSPSGLFYHPLPSPVRLVETRAGQSGCFQPAQLQGTNNPNANPSLDLQVQGRSPGLPSPCNSIPNDAVVLVGNATTVLPNAPLGFGYLTIYPSDANRPTVASSNYAGGDVINGPFAVKLGADGKFKIYTFSTTDLVVDISGYYSASAVDANGAGLLFTPLPKPMRLLETRADFPGFPLTGCYRTNAPIAGLPNIRTQQVWGTCSDQPLTIPTTARAIVGNVTALNSTGAGFLTFFPGDVATAPTVATSNYPFPASFGYNRHYYVGLGAVDGTFKLLTQFTSDLIVDVSGFFAP